MPLIEVNGDNFKEEVLNSNKKVLVDFNANWCGPCKMMRPILEELSNDNEEYKIVSINIDEEDELAEEYEVSSIPCLVLFEKGKEINRSVGLIPKESIENMLGGK